MPYQQNLLALKGKKYVLIVLSLLFLGAIIWAGIALLSSQMESSVDKKVLQAAKTLKPYLNTTVVEEIGKKTEFSEEELKNFNVRIFNYDPKTREKNIQIIDNS